ncbi:DUF4160 domain-containing protein [Leptolyngbya ohadii]|uniref:DUF4160 domain-containing protein n=1 Tax=Leptolyngbya ohadii TaxID=1962290 RepID=UPI000B599A97|nr:DUF4160 domain-containing protein [Leptolyngbya ohadii]
MPTIHRELGFQFRIYPNDHAPAHVHAFKGKGEVRINIQGADGDPEFITIHDMSDKDAGKAWDIVSERQEQFLKEWQAYHGNKGIRSGKKS